MDGFATPSAALDNALLRLKLEISVGSMTTSNVRRALADPACPEVLVPFLDRELSRRGSDHGE